MFGSAGAAALDDDTGTGEGFGHQIGICDAFGSAAREQVGVCTPCLQGGLLAGRSDIGVVKADRRSKNLERGHGR